MNATRPLRGCLIGAGFFARFHAEGWNRVPDAEITAVCDPASGKAAAFAAAFGIARAYEDVGEMLDTEDPDFADIATRPDTHLGLVETCAGRGIDIICQKPMAPTMKESERLCEICEGAHVRLLIHENWRWQPWYREAKRLLESGALGNLRHLSFDWRTSDGNGPEPFAAQPYFREMPRLLIHESLVHILDTYRYLTGAEPEVTRCETRRVNPVLNGEDWAEIDLAFPGGATAHIHGDRQSGPKLAPIAMGSMLLEGSRATLRIAPDGSLFLDGKPLPFDPPTNGYKGDSVRATQEHLATCLRSGEPAESEGRAYLRNVKLVEACYAADSHSGAGA